MISDQNRVVEGMTSFLGGANSSVDPALLPDTQYSWGVNIQIRDGYPKTRPGFVHVKSLPRGVIQGAMYFKTGSNEDIVSLIDGRLYSLKPTRKTASVVDVSPQGQGDVVVPRKASMTTTTSGSVVVQDGFNPPMIYNGSSSYRSKQIVEDLPPTFESQATIGANNPRIRMPSTAGVVPGMLVKAERGIPEKTLVVSVDSQTELTLSKNCTLTALATLQFYAAGDLSLDVSVPIGDIVVYGNGRLWVARRNELYAGDLIGVAPGSDLLFSETQYLTGGGSFYFSNPITGLAFLPGGDTSTGQGDLIVFTKTDIHAVRSYIYDRTQWQTTSGMQRQLFFGRGAENHDSIIVTSNDIYFRSLDGIRSLSQTLATKGSFIKFTDSLEAQRVVGYDTERWLQYVPGVFFDGRYLLGAAPKIQKISDGSGGFSRDYNVVFSKILSKDFDAGIGQDGQIEAFDGEWTGLQVCKFVEGSFDGKRRCFAIVCGSDGENALYEITLDGIEDEVPGENNTISYLPISSSIEMKRFSFGDPFQIKELLRADISFSETQKPVTWSLTYAPDYYPGFLPIQTGTVNFDYETPTLTTVSPPNLSSGYKTFRTVKPTDVCVSGVSRRSSVAYLFQPKVSWVGRAKLSLFRLHALRKDSSDLGEC